MRIGISNKQNPSLSVDGLDWLNCEIPSERRHGQEAPPCHRVKALDANVSHLEVAPDMHEYIRCFGGETTICVCVYFLQRRGYISTAYTQLSCAIYRHVRVPGGNKEILASSYSRNPSIHPVRQGCASDSETFRHCYTRALICAWLVGRGRFEAMISSTTHIGMSV